MANAGRIKVSTEDFAQAIMSYNKAKGEQEMAYQAMKAAVDGLNGLYTGPASSACQTAFSTLHQNIASGSETISKIIKALTTTEEQFAQAEQSTESSMASADTGHAATT